MSAYVTQKAQNLIDTNSVTRISNTSYTVKSSNNTPYIIIDEICQCVGFGSRGECSHVLAVKLHKDSANRSAQNLGE